VRVLDSTGTIFRGRGAVYGWTRNCILGFLKARNTLTAGIGFYHAEFRFTKLSGYVTTTNYNKLKIQTYKHFSKFFLSPTKKTGGPLIASLQGNTLIVSNFLHVLLMRQIFLCLSCAMLSVQLKAKTSQKLQTRS